MNKKAIILSSVVIILVVGAGYLYVPQFKSYSKKFQIKETNQLQNQMSGEVVEVKNSSIVVEGMVGRENKKIEFIITPETVLKNGSNTITLEQIRSGKSFQPKFEQKTGKISDFVQNTNISITRIQSKENLFIINKTTATLIDYVTFIFPTK